MTAPTVRRILPCGRNGFANALNGNQRLLHDKRHVEMQDAIAQASKLSVAALVSRNAPTMPEAEMSRISWRPIVARFLTERQA